MSKEIKHKIRQAFEAETPDVRDRVLSACEGQEQVPPLHLTQTKERSRRAVSMRRAWLTAACLMLFFAGVLAGYLLPLAGQGGAEETYVYLDVNPSIELALDGENRVVSCTAINEDAEGLLSDMSLEGVELNTALHALVGAMYVQGYLSEEDNSILVSVDGTDGEAETSYLCDITDRINAIFADAKMECSIIAQQVRRSEELRGRAEQYGISVGKMHFLDKMVAGHEELSQENLPALSDLSIKELQLIYSTKPEGQGKDEVHSGSPSGFVTPEMALGTVLSHLGLEQEETVFARAVALPGERGLVYTVTVLPKGQGGICFFQVDCRTGELIEPEDGGYQPPAIQGEGKHQQEEPPNKK